MLFEVKLKLQENIAIMLMSPYLTAEDRTFLEQTAVEITHTVMDYFASQGTPQTSPQT